MARPNKIALLLVAILVGGTTAAHAATYTYSSYTVPGEQFIQITSPAQVSGGMGQIDLVGTGPSNNVNILAWCLDVYTYLLGDGYGSGPFTYNIITPLTNVTENVGFSTDGHNNSATLTTSQINEIGGLIAYGNANIATSNVSAATQLAIWEIEYGGVFSFTGVSNATKNLASTEVSEVETNVIPLNSHVALLTQGGSEANQTLAYISATPVPAALPLFGSGIAGLFLLGWHRGRRAQAIA